MSNKIRLIAFLFLAFSTICNAQKLPTYSQFPAKVEKKTAKKVTSKVIRKLKCIEPILEMLWQIRM